MTDARHTSIKVIWQRLACQHDWQPAPIVLFSYSVLLNDYLPTPAMKR